MSGRRMVAVLGALLGALLVVAGGSRSAAATAAAAPPADERFQEANRAFDLAMASEGEERDERLRRSIDLFESLIEDEGIRNGYLYFNLGNAYYALGEIGRAILAYRRAERLVPGYQPLAENLQAAIRQRIDRGGHGALEGFVRKLTFRSYWFDYPTTVRLFTGTFVAVFALLAVRLFVRPPLFRTLVTVLAAGALLSGSAAAWYVYEAASDRSGVIVADESDARKGPGRSYEQEYTRPLHEGTEFEWLGQRAGWLHVELRNGDDTWIPSEDARLVVPRD